MLTDDHKEYFIRDCNFNMTFLSVALPAPKQSSAQEKIKEKITNFLSMPSTKQITLDTKAN